MTVVLRDVSYRRQAEETTQRLGRILDNSSDEIYVFDADTLKFIFANKGALQNIGYTLKELQNLTPIDLKPRFTRESFNFLVKPLHSGQKERLVFETVHQRKDGSQYPVEVRLHLSKTESPPVFFAIVQDITERKRAEDALRKSEEKYRQLFEEDLTANYISTPQGEILFCNPAFLRIFGFNSVEEAQKSKAEDFYPDPQKRKEFISLLRQKRKLELYEVEYRTHDGRTISVIQNVVGAFNDKNELTEIKCYAFDITEHKKTQDQFRQAQKMEAIGQLAGGVAHDFNNLLTIINGYSELLLRRLPADAPSRKELKLIHQAGKKAASLTEQLLAFSRRQILKQEILNLNSIVFNIEKMLRRLIGENVELVTVLAPNLDNIKADHGQIEQVIMNLAVNARDAMPDGGQLLIETNNAYLDEKYARNHISVKPGDYVMLAVSDTGTGMDKETVSRIFEPFFTTKPKEKGTGLGLSTVYGIIKQSGGYIWVYSEPGKGTTFKIYIPKVTATVESTKRTRPSPESLTGNETILLVEDDPEVRNFSRDLLTEYGYNVLEAENGEQALAVCRQYEKSIHLIISDVIMPQMGGRDLERAILKLNRNIKFLFVSGYTDNAIVHQGVLDKNVNFLQKPFSPEELALKVRELLETG